MSDYHCLSRGKGACLARTKPESLNAADEASLIEPYS